jgi:hypothetical protein
MIPLPSYSQIAELFKAGATIEAQEQIMKLRQAALDLQEQNISLTEKLREAEEKLRVRCHLTFKKPLYWADGDSTPFCPICLERDSRVIHLDGPDSYEDGQVSYVCRVCQKTIEVQPARLRPPSLDNPGWIDAG